MANTDVLLRILSEVDDAVNDLKKVDKGMAKVEKQGKKTESSVKKLGGGLKNLATALGIGASLAVVVRSLVKFGTESIDVASRVEELGAKFDVVFGEKAGEARQRLDEFGDAVNRSGIDLQDMASEGQNVLVALGLQRDAAAEYSIGMTELAVDVAAFQNAEDADVLNSFTSAIVGNHIAAKKFGVIINEASLSQQLFNMGVTGGMKAATEAEKAIARYNIILNATADSHGAAAREAGSYANVTKGLEAAMTDLKAAVGEQLLPTMTELKIVTTDLIKGLTENIEKSNLLRTIEEKGILTKKQLRNAHYSVGDASKYSNNELTKLVEQYEKEQGILVSSSSNYEGYVRLLDEAGTSTKELTEAEYAEVVASQLSAEADAVQTENLLEQKGAMEDIRFGLNDLTGKKEDYIEKTQELQREAADLNGILDGQVSIYDSEYDSISEVSAALAENIQKQADLESQLDRTTANLIYQKIAQDLDAEASLALARELNLLDEQSYLLGITIDNLTEQYNSGQITIDEYKTAVSNAKTAVLSSDGITSDMFVNVHHTTTYSDRYSSDAWLRGYRGYADGADFQVPHTGAAGGDYFPFQGMLKGGEDVSITPQGKGGNNAELIKEVKALRKDIRESGAGATALDIASALSVELQKVMG